MNKNFSLEWESDQKGKLQQLGKMTKREGGKQKTQRTKEEETDEKKQGKGQESVKRKLYTTYWCGNINTYLVRWRYRVYDSNTHRNY